MKVLHVFTLATTAESFFDGQFDFLSQAGYELQMAASDSPSDDFCLRNHITAHQVNIARRIDLKADLTAIVQLVRLIRRENFDAVAGHTPKAAMVAMIAARLAGIKRRVYYRHGLIYTTATGLRRRVFKCIEQFTSALSTHIVNVSPSLSKLAVADHLNNDRKQTVIGRGTCGGIDASVAFNPESIDSDELSALKDSLVGQADLIVGFCGRLCRDKGIVELIDGFELFQKRHTQLKSKLLLVGPYDQRDVLAQDTVMEIDRNKDIIATGRREQSELPLFYSLMDVFVFPSYREGFGMTVLEASAMTVPILVSRSHGCVDSIKENVTGRYIDISAEGIADGLESMLDSKLRSRLGRNGRNFVIENFSHSVMWPEIRKYYDNVLFKENAK